jgi:transposase
VAEPAEEAEGNSGGWRHDPDAKIGRTKDGATDMVYLPEHTVDLDTGVLVRAQVLPGDHRDSEELSARVVEAVINVREATGDPEAVPETLTGDKGYFSLLEIGRLAGTQPQDGDQRPAPRAATLRQAK